MHIVCRKNNYKNCASIYKSFICKTRRFLSSIQCIFILKLTKSVRTICRVLHGYTRASCLRLKPSLKILFITNLNQYIFLNKISVHPYVVLSSKKKKKKKYEYVSFVFK